MSIPHICRRCQQEMLQWRKHFYSSQLLQPDIKNRSISTLRKLWTATRPVSPRFQTSTKDNDGRLQDIFNAIIRPSASPLEKTRQRSSSPVEGLIQKYTLRRFSGREQETDEKAKERLYLKRLDRALTMRNVAMAEGVWQDVEQWYRERSKCVSKADITREASMNLPGGSDPDSVSQEASRIGGPSAYLYCQFLVVFMSLRRPDRANEVWKHTVQAGLHPNQAFWNAMLSGCRGARDTNSLEEIWKELLNSGMAPDAICWSTRIHVLIMCGKIREGIEALKQMTHIWRKAAEEELSKRTAEQEQISLAEMGDIGSIVKPTIDTINAALMALLRYKKIETAQAMLNWAAGLGIQPDLATYNMLLRYTIYEDSPESALEIYNTMEAAGVQPDIYTFTAILEGYFRYNARTDPSTTSSSQKDLVQSLFTEMEAAGIPSTVHTYGIMIDHLLQPQRANQPGESENLAAAQAVLKHMQSKNLKPNALINTILITYHFSQQPPDIGAINTVWNGVKHQPDDYAPTDYIFYERLLEGYARADEADTMMEVFRHIRRQAGGRRLRWDTMKQMVDLLVHVGRNAEAGGLVRDLVRKEGIFREGCRGPVESERAFWEFVWELRRRGLLEEGEAG